MHVTGKTNGEVNGEEDWQEAGRGWGGGLRKEDL